MFMKQTKNDWVLREEKILKFWQKNQIFEKSVKTPAGSQPQGDYVFYDGPPFATGLPHYGHIVASVIKDTVPRYWTMKGYRVERKWGWDCHGLPIENIVEKEMGSRKKKDIEKIGVERFNQLCRSKVLSYTEDWKKIIQRLGRFVDMENAYKTMDLDFMESVWWVFKELWKKGLIYEGYRSMHICPRCETTLSQSEVTEGYKITKDLSCIAKFELADSLDFEKISGPVYFLAWTTTPWTLIGNVALAVNKEIDYVLIKTKGKDNEYFVLAQKKLEAVFEGKDYDILAQFKGDKILGKKYKPLFDYYFKDKNLSHRENGWQVYHGDFVNIDEGTGIVHIAPAFGEDDMLLGKKYRLPFIQYVDMSGRIKDQAVDFVGLNVKPADNHMATDIEIIKYLGRRNKLFAKKKYEHSYPHCWRCDTPLINYATHSWFVAITKIKEKMLEKARYINWSPSHIKKGRFGNWLLGARDWSISRQRFWASVIPVWVCDKCNKKKVVGSIKELEKLSHQKIFDLHKHIVDKIVFSCDCGGVMKRVPDVLDTWFDSGAMPYAQMHYPFENKQKFENNFPAEFIAEGQDQTRAWFYYLHAIAVGIKESHAYKNVIVNGIVLAEDGKKMSKKLKNYPDPQEILDNYGADALRYYLLTSPVTQAENLNFSEKGVEEALKKVLMILNNVVKFFVLFSENATIKKPNFQNLTVLDKWILTRLNQTIKEITQSMDNYNLVKATRPLGKFITDLSTWYLRRSRDRFKSQNKKEREQVIQVTYFVLFDLSRLMAPFLPFIAEYVYKEIKGKKESVHLESWPKTEAPEEEEIILKMELVRKIVEKSLFKRADAGIKVRQPLQKLTVQGVKENLDEEYLKLVKEEVNVKEIKIKKGDKLEVELDTKITPELKQEGILRELVRLINGIRKQAGFTVKDTISIYWESSDKTVKEAISRFKLILLKETLADKIIQKRPDLPSLQEKEVKLETTNLWIGIKK